MSKQCLDVQQMQHLQELGLETSNASMLYCDLYDEEYILVGGKHRFDKEENAILLEGVRNSVIYCKKVTPAYTLQDVLDALTRWEINDGFCPRITIDLSERLIRCHYKDKERVGMVMKSFDGNGTGSLIDAVYELLCWAIGKKFVKTDKNKLE